MTFEDFASQFDNIYICRVAEWNEVRLRGKFTKSPYPSKDDNFVSKSMYAFNIVNKTHLIIGLHQDDIN